MVEVVTDATSPVLAPSFEIEGEENAPETDALSSADALSATVNVLVPADVGEVVGFAIAVLSPVMVFEEAAGRVAFPPLLPDVVDSDGLADAATILASLEAEVSGEVAAVDELVVVVIAPPSAEDCSIVAEVDDAAPDNDAPPEKLLVVSASRAVDEPADGIDASAADASTEASVVPEEAVGTSLCGTALAVLVEATVSDSADVTLAPPPIWRCSLVESVCAADGVRDPSAVELAWSSGEVVVAFAEVTTAALFVCPLSVVARVLVSDAEIFASIVTSPPITATIECVSEDDV